MAAVKRRKPKTERKEFVINVRVTAEQKDVLVDAATKIGLGVSSWMLMLALKEAKKTAGDAGE